MCECRGLEPEGSLRSAFPRAEPWDQLARDLYDAQLAQALSQLPPEFLGRAYEHFLDRPVRPTAAGTDPAPIARNPRRARGVYYTPEPIVDYVVRHTIGPLPSSPTLLVLDPACGGGYFLLAAYRILLDAYSDRGEPDAPRPLERERAAGNDRRPLTVPERIRVLDRHIHGVDADPRAVEVTRRSLLLEAMDGDVTGSSRESLRLEARATLARQIRCGDAIVGPDFRPELSENPPGPHRVRPIDWPVAFPEAFAGHAPGFDVVLGNPPWGQKQVERHRVPWAYLRRRYRSLAGLADLFRPFVERAVTLVRPGGTWGMVLPDIVLLKDYEATRRFLLDELSLTHVDWWGAAFSTATIDVTTMIGRRVMPGPDHVVHVAVRDGETPVQHVLPQADFRRNEGLTFNLHLTPERRAILDHLAGYAKLGETCEMHEGVHSGNIRSELFVDRPVDASCRPLLFGRDEIAPYDLHWNGKHVRLSAVPPTRSPGRYANVGRPEWYERDKLLVRRTGDFVLAAVDRHRRYASNNFFLVWPTVDHPLSLDGLCALLNSPLITWFFRCIEPRRGRPFAELKIKHLRRFPIPGGTTEPALVRRLNTLGAARAELARRQRRTRRSPQRVALTTELANADRQIADTVFAALDLGDRWRKGILSETPSTRSGGTTRHPLG
jgi:hypothetical protein